jgi:hypothetical protein
MRTKSSVQQNEVVIASSKRTRVAKLTWITAAALLLLLTSCGIPATNDGKEYGYYGEFNRASNALVAIPGIRITNVWMNRDTVLEEFGFDIVTMNGQPVHIGFDERDPRRKLSRTELTKALAAEIQQKTQATTK